MTEKAIAQRLPADVLIDFGGIMQDAPRIFLQMTLSSPDHANALKEAIDKAILPLLERYVKKEIEVAVEPETSVEGQQRGGGAPMPAEEPAPVSQEGGKPSALEH